MKNSTDPVHERNETILRLQMNLFYIFKRNTCETKKKETRHYYVCQLTYFIYLKQRKKELNTCETKKRKKTLLCLPIIKKINTKTLKKTL